MMTYLTYLTYLYLMYLRLSMMALRPSHRVSGVRFCGG